MPRVADCHSLNRHAKWNCLTAGGGSEGAGADLLPSGMWERASKIYGFWRSSIFLSFLYSYTSQPRLADCWQLHDIFAVTWLESEASDKFLVWMSSCDMQWQIYFLLLQVCSVSCAWGFWCYSCCGREWFACFPCASVSPPKERWGKWHIPHLLWWRLLFLPCCSVTQARIIFSGFSRAHLLAGGSKCSVEKNPTFPVAVAEFRVSWIYVTGIYIQKLGVLLEWCYCILGRYTSQNTHSR